MDKPYRSIVKALSWRIAGTIDTMVISWIITRRLTFALTIGVVEVFTKMILYYLHERVWNKLEFGRVKKIEPEYSI